MMVGRAREVCLSCTSADSLQEKLTLCEPQLRLTQCKPQFYRIMCEPQLKLAQRELLLKAKRIRASPLGFSDANCE